LGGKGVHGLVSDGRDVQPGEDLSGDPVDDGVLHGRVGPERRDARDVTIGV
jgi:hypothetical protein